MTTHKLGSALCHGYYLHFSSEASRDAGHSLKANFQQEKSRSVYCIWLSEGPSPTTADLVQRSSEDPDRMSPPPALQKSPMWLFKCLIISSAVDAPEEHERWLGAHVLWACLSRAVLKRHPLGFSACQTSKVWNKNCIKSLNYSTVLTADQRNRPGQLLNKSGLMCQMALYDLGPMPELRLGSGCPYYQPVKKNKWKKGSPPQTLP